MNIAILCGTLGKDVELKTTESGLQVAKVSIATNKTYKNKAGEKQTQTTWHNLIAWKHTAVFLEQYFKKGSKILIHGEISNRSYEKDGVKKYTSEIIVSQIEFAGGKADETVKPKKIVEEEISVEDIPF